MTPFMRMMLLASGVGPWILATHRWRDTGHWVDTAFWKD